MVTVAVAPVPPPPVMMAATVPLARPLPAFVMVTLLSTPAVFAFGSDRVPSPDMVSPVGFVPVIGPLIVRVEPLLVMTMPSELPNASVVAMVSPVIVALLVRTARSG